MPLETRVIDLLRKTRLGKHPTAGKFLADLAVYIPLGYLPQKIQVRLAEKSGINKTGFFWYQAGFSLTFAATRFLLGYGANQGWFENYWINYAVNSIGLSLELSSLDIFMTGIRACYVLPSKKPIGALTLEIPYWLWGKISKKHEENSSKAVQAYQREKPAP